jgi:hypothetical protein
MAKVPGEQPLKCEVAAALAEAYQHLGQATYQQQALEAGLRHTLTDPSNTSTRCARGITGLMGVWSLYGSVCWR